MKASVLTQWLFRIFCSLALICCSMGIMWTLTFHPGWFGWFESLGCITFLSVTDRRVLMQTHPNNSLGGRFHKTDVHPLSFPYVPTKAKTHQMKTCCDVTSKIGFQRICCDESLIKLVYFSTAYVCNNTEFKARCGMRNRLCLNGSTQLWKHCDKCSHCCVMTLVWENIKTKTAETSLCCKTADSSAELCM